MLNWILWFMIKWLKMNLKNLLWIFSLILNRHPIRFKNSSLLLCLVFLLYSVLVSLFSLFIFSKLEWRNKKFWKISEILLKFLNKKMNSFWVILLFNGIKKCNWGRELSMLKKKKSKKKIFNSEKHGLKHN